MTVMIFYNAIRTVCKQMRLCVCVGHYTLCMCLWYVCMYIHTWVCHINYVWLCYIGEYQYDHSDVCCPDADSPVAVGALLHCSSPPGLV